MEVTMLRGSARVMAWVMTALRTSVGPAGIAMAAALLLSGQSGAPALADDGGEQDDGVIRGEDVGPGVDEAPNSGVATQYDLELLMKEVCNPRTPFGGSPVEQIQFVAGFGELTPVQRDKAVPELLALLQNTTRVSSEGLDSGGVLAVRDRANAALARVSRVFLGRFPPRRAGEAPSAEEQASDAKACEELISRWKEWWKESRALDAAGLAKLASKLRGRLLESKDEELFWVNVTFALMGQDPAPIAQVAERVRAADMAKAEEVETALQVYWQLCQLPSAPPESALVLVDFIKKHNRPVRCGPNQVSLGALQMAAMALVELAAVHDEEYLQVSIAPEAIKRWEDAIKAKARAKAVKGESAPQARGAAGAKGK